MTAQRTAAELRTQAAALLLEALNLDKAELAKRAKS